MYYNHDLILALSEESTRLSDALEILVNRVEKRLPQMNEAEDIVKALDKAKKVLKRKAKDAL